jgi:hypothetical protein
MYIPYDRPSVAEDAGSGTGSRQTVFVHTLKEIQEASAPYFTFCGEELLEAYDFTLIHLIRNEKQD